MSSRLRHFISWLAGLLGLAFVIWHFQLSAFDSHLGEVGIRGFLAWLVLTLLARSALVEITVLPIRRLGFELQRFDAFWIGWVRTFANQILPLSGLALFTREIRRKAQVPWSALVALSTPMILFAAAAVSCIGLIAVWSGSAYLGRSTIPMLVTFLLVGAGSVLMATHAAWLLERLPGAILAPASQSADAFRRLSDDRTLVLQVIALHMLAILLRGGRIWLLFLTVGADVSVEEALLIAVVAEAAGLFQITPGGLGLREGAIIGAAALTGLPTELGATVALIDRLFMVAVTTFLAIPGYWLLRRN